MKKSLQKTQNSLKQLENGMSANPNDWDKQPVKVTDVQAEEEQILIKSNALDAASATLTERQHDANAENNVAKKLITQVSTLAYGIYVNNPEKLAEYGLKPRKAPEKISAPTKTLAIKINDDTDGEGFVLSLAARDTLAENYEWQKGIAADPKDTSTIPAMQFFKNTTKSSFLDDDVIKGVRYFYRVRAQNSSGQGPWSESASRVQ